MFDLFIAWLLALFAGFADVLPAGPHETPAVVQTVGNDVGPSDSVTSPGPSRGDKNDATGDIYNGF